MGRNGDGARADVVLVPLAEKAAGHRVDECGVGLIFDVEEIEPQNKAGASIDAQDKVRKIVLLIFAKTRKGDEVELAL